MKPTPADHTKLACVVYFALHVAVSLGGRVFGLDPQQMFWNPSAGLALALLTLLGPGFFPVVLVANLLTVFVAPEVPLWGLKLLLPAVFTINYTGMAWCIRRLVGPMPLLRNFRETLLLTLATGAAPVVASIGGAWLLQSGGLVLPDRFLPVAVRWWISDENGILTVVPGIMVFAAPIIRGKHGPRFRQWGPRRWVEIVAQVVALPACLWLVFSTSWLLEYHAFYLCFLPLIWICLKHGLPGAALATFGMTITP